MQVAPGETEQEVTLQGGIFATVKASVTGEYSKQGTGSSWYTTTCSADGGLVRMDATREEHMGGSGAAEGKVMINLTPDGSYSIAASSNAAFSAEGQVTAQEQTCRGAETGTQALGPYLIALNIPNIAGQIDPRLPNTLKGSKTETSRVGDSTKTTTITWDLRRD